MIENQVTGGAINQAVVGVGFNVNQQHFGVSTATSLCLIQPGLYDLNTTFADLLAALERRFLQLRERKFTVLKEDYLSRLYQYQEEHLYEGSSGSVFRGTITGIDAVGRLKMWVDGEEKTFDIKDIRYC